jgi:hypothetical protein
MKKTILRIDGIFLMVMGTMAAITDIIGYYSGNGPFGRIYFQNNITIGGFEAHSLAIILGIILFIKSKASDAHFFNKIAVAIHLVLGVSNLVWFDIFFETGSISMGYTSTIAHFTLVLLNIIAISRKPRPS